MFRPSRRTFLSAMAGLAAGGLVPQAAASALSWVRPLPVDPIFPVPARRWHGGSSVAFALRDTACGDLEQDAERRPREPRDRDRRPRQPAERFADLRRHFVFEYYPWYGTEPWFHWNESGRVPPVDIAASSYPLLGPYDSRSTAVVEQHARWIAEAGIGAVNLSWWGRDDYTDRAVSTVMDVMRAHDVHVTFHIEPYRTDRGDTLAADILYLVREYGDRRHWDNLLLLENADGRSGPVFKLFSAILLRTSTDCHGVTRPVAHYVEDGAWRRQLDLLRAELRNDFDHVTVLSDSLDVARNRAAGFDGFAIYDNFVAPSTWAKHASSAAAADLLFSFNVNAGYDGIRQRSVPPDSCYRPTPFEPGGREYDWSQDASRDEAMRLGTGRIEESFKTTIGLQAAADSPNAKRGFLLVYVNSFNEWHEGTQFEPMKAARDLTADERAIGYHNAPVGDYRLRAVQRLVAGLAGGV
jgi:hypothetical protein